MTPAEERKIVEDAIKVLGPRAVLDIIRKHAQQAHLRRGLNREPPRSSPR